mmetsp:Transcript_10811/g.21970  ORF Transcript_10811/g.21970 Transcript_10811/m.21970 type:complete len:391 (+) Transcript_10811:78-1250(+)
MTLLLPSQLSRTAATFKHLPRALNAGRSSGGVASSAAGSSTIKRFFAAAAAATHEWPSIGNSTSNSSHHTYAGRWRNNYGKYAAIAAGTAAAQYYFGEADEFFDHRFTTDKKPEDLADLYGTEAFMEIFCVLPFMANFMMRSGEFDDDGHIRTFGLAGPGNLEVSIDFDEAEEDTTGDGELDTIAWFNKRESFHDVSPIGSFTLWQMTQNFGYHRLHDGTCEVYHNGEHFRGLFPVRFLFQAHAAYVFWATQRYITSDEFGTENLEDEAEEYRQNIPSRVFKDFILGLANDVESLKQAKGATDESTQEYDETIEKLKDLSEDERRTNLAHFTTIRRHNSSLTKLKLVVDDADTHGTISKALKQVGEGKGKDAPVTSVRKLQRRATRAQEE